MSREKRLFNIITAAFLGAGWFAAAAGAWAEGEPQIWDKIVFSTRRDVNRNSEIYLMDLDGSNQINLTNDPASDCEPAVSPDGKEIAFTSDRDVVCGIYIMKADGSGVKRLTPPDMRGSSPAFSPDGKRIVFSSFTNKGNMEIFIIKTDGTELKRLTNTNDINEDNPCFHPDGGIIAYTFEPPLCYDYNTEIFTMNNEGSEQQRLTYGRKVEIYPDYFEGISSAFPVYFPNGKRLAFWSSDLYEDGVYIMNADGTGRERLTYDGSYPAVSPDGTKIAYDPGYLKTREIYLINVDGNGETRLTVNSVPDSEPSFAPMLIDGRLLDYYGHWHDIGQ